MIGLGQIGSRVSRLGNAFGMKVLAFDPYITDRSFSDAGAEAAGKERVVSQADFLTLHTPDRGDAQNGRETGAFPDETCGLPDQHVAGGSGGRKRPPGGVEQRADLRSGPRCF
ncbi:MAG: hypothetical protein MZU91_11980 [Desulfosudis oleivorans]|nr:hypothetical protein [Desulfosudis oleivorans]